MEHPSKIKKKRKRKTKHKSSKFSEHELKMRSLRGSELSKESNTPIPTDTEEAMLLERKDLDDITHHRFDHLHHR